MTRKCSAGVIEEICKFCEETEVPAVFALWSGIFAVNACLKRNCFIDQGHFTVYPNLYINLTGKSGCKKSTAIYITSDFLQEVDPPINILSQRITPQELIGTLSGKIIKEKTIIVEEAIGCFIADELSTLIDKTSEMKVLIPILTKLYDCKDFDYATRKFGKEIVKNPCLSILGGSTIEWIKEVFPMYAIGGGFTARFIFPYQEGSERRIAWPRMSEKNMERYKRIAYDLNEINKLRGPVGVSEDAINLYSEEYVEFLKGPMAKDILTSRYAERRHINLLKIAMALSASYRDTREIIREDIWKAIQIIKGSENKRSMIMRKIASEPVGDICEHIMTLIMTAGSIYRSDLIYETRHKITHKELNVILEGLIESGYVKKDVVGGKLSYRYEKKRS